MEKIDQPMKQRVERAKEEAPFPAETRKLLKEEDDRVNKEQDDCIIRNGGVREPAGRPDKKCPPIVMPFADYLHYVRKTVTANWAWQGKKGDLPGPVAVRFGITENGEVEKLRITKFSGTVSYDESVLRAVKKSAPFKPVPKSAMPKHMADQFSDMELTFKINVIK